MTEEKQDIVAEVVDLLVSVLKVSVVVIDAVQFKTYSDKPGPIKVTPVLTIRLRCSVRNAKCRNLKTVRIFA